jgi:hypothetical protein
LYPAIAASSLRPLMRGILAWVMVVCVFAGLNSRITANVCNDPADCGHAVDVCCQGSPHAGQPLGGTHHDGDDCPMDHHHHHSCCSHAFVLGLDPQLPCRFGVSDSARAGFRHQGEAPPDGPFLASEKPPLI